MIEMYFCFSPYFKFPTNCYLFRTWCRMLKIIVRDSFWSNLIIVDALSETEMRWKRAFMIGFSLVFLTSMILALWGHRPPFRTSYQSSTVDLDQNPSKNVFSFNLEQCPSCKSSIQKSTGRWPFLFTSDSQTLFAGFKHLETLQPALATLGNVAIGNVWLPLPSMATQN